MCRATSDSYVQDRMSDLISLLRFPLMVTVVLLHCSFDLVMRNGMLEDSVCYADYTCFRLFVTEITNAAVALFFVFSGYLFFRNGTLTLHSYGNKLQKRFYTILLPYLLWSIIYIALYFVAQLLLPTAMEGVMKPVTDFTMRDWFSCLWDVEDIARRNGPIVSQFWYLKELMIAVVLAPLLYGGVRYIRGWFFLVLLAMYLLPVSSPTVVGILFFTLGTYLGVYKINIMSVAYTYRWVSTLLFVGLTTMLIALGCNIGVIYHLDSLLGAMAYVGWGTYILRTKHSRMPTILAASSFFLFAYHQLPVRLVTKIAAPFIIESGFGYMVAQLVICALMSAVGVGLYYILRTVLPRFTALLCGGR